MRTVVAGLGLVAALIVGTIVESALSAPHGNGRNNPAAGKFGEGDAAVDDALELAAGGWAVECAVLPAVGGDWYPPPLEGIPRLRSAPATPHYRCSPHRYFHS